MRHVGMDDIRAFDKLKSDIFQSKKNDFKNTLKKNFKPSAPRPSKLKFPWKSLTKICVLVGGIYAVYNYREQAFYKLYRQHYFSVLDINAYNALKQDLKIKTSLFSFSSAQKQENATTSLTKKSFANQSYIRRLQNDYKHLCKTFPSHRIKSSTFSRFRFWVFSFNNSSKELMVNKHGDLIERQKKAYLKLWNWMVWAACTDRVIEPQIVFDSYENLILAEEADEKRRRGLQENSNQKQDNLINRNILLGNSISSKCKIVNSLNIASEHYDELLTQCHQNSYKISEKISKVIKQRQKSNLKAKVKTKATSN